MCWNFSHFFPSRIFNATNFVPLIAVQRMFLVQFTSEKKSHRFFGSSDIHVIWRAYMRHECTKFKWISRNYFYGMWKKANNFSLKQVKKNRSTYIVNLCNQFTANGEKTGLEYRRWITAERIKNDDVCSCGCGCCFHFTMEMEMEIQEHGYKWEKIK